jgi:DNA-binding MarR family transcriptional regulator
VKTIIENLNKAFENRIRLGAMSALMVNESMDFNALKELLDVTDGNLASHISALEKAGYVDVRKVFIGKKPNTSYAASNEGRKAFKEHLDALETLIRNNSGL